MNFLNKKNKPAKALVLMSGGLDSILAVKILESLGIEVFPVCFESYFFSSDEAKKSAAAIGIDLRVEDISTEHLEIVKHPHFGYGAAMNPCIDCHLLMLKTAGKIMGADGLDFVATGEVLGERPMSQNKQSLETIEKGAGLGGRLLRPLSAKLLPETVAERSGLVEREKLFAISGRSRKPQIELARFFNVSYVPQPGGGCILTETDYGRRLRELIDHCPDFDGMDAKILRCGRIVWSGSLLFVVARNQKECEFLLGRTKPGDFIFRPINFSGPIAIARDFGKKYSNFEIGNMGKQLILNYSKKAPINPEISFTNV